MGLFMQLRRDVTTPNRLIAVFVCGFLLVAGFVIVNSVAAASAEQNQGGRLVTFYDRGQKRVVLTHAQTVKEALEYAQIRLGEKDIVEPKRGTELVANGYVINIFRARPVVVVDGPVRQKIMTAKQTPEDIASTAGTTLRDEDKAEVIASQNIVADGAGVVLSIERAVGFTLKLYGKNESVYTRAKTVGEMLERKGIKLSPADTLSISKSAPIVTGMTIEVWRDGVQAVTVEEPVAFTVRKIQDADRPIGFHEIQTPGTEGKKSVAYEITAQAGKEIGRKMIQSVVTLQPKEQIEIIGVKPGPNSLTKSKGAQQFMDSRGVSHRETYYDLPMNVVMGACGGGTYTVRADGAKVDKDGYILIAANLQNYPRCSIVETSMGLGKVYDTGGFAVKYPHGFDLATDWTKGDGR